MRKLFIIAILFASCSSIASPVNSTLYSALLREGRQPLNVDYQWRTQRQHLSLSGRQWWKLLRCLEDGRWDAEALAPVRQQLPLTLSLVQMKAARRLQTPIAGTELLETYASYRRLRSLVDAELRRSDSFYFPSSLIRQGAKAHTRMHEWEDQLFLRWSAFSELELDIAEGSLVELLAKLSERAPQEPREIFDRLLELVVSSHEDELWSEFQERMQDQLLAERLEVLSVLVPPLQALVQQRSWAAAKPEQLQVAARGDLTAISVGASFEADYSYSLDEGVPHQAVLSLRRADGTLIEQRKLPSSERSGSCMLAGIRAAGNYELSLSVRTQFGWQAVRDASLLVSGESAVDDQRELLETFAASLKRRAELATHRLTALAAQQRDLERQLQLLSPSLDAMEDQISEDNAYSSVRQVEGKWLRSGRYDSYLGQLERYNQLVDQVERVEAQGEILDSQRKQFVELAEQVSEQVQHFDLDRALHTALESGYADDLGYTKRLEAFMGNEPQIELALHQQLPQRKSQRRFIRAVLANDLDTASLSLAAGIDINTRDPYTNEHILHLYLRAADPQLATLRFLIHHGADPHATDAQGNGLSPLMVLALSGGGGSERKDILHYLIDLGVPFTQEALSQVQHKEALLQDLEASASQAYLFEEGVQMLREALR